MSAPNSNAAAAVYGALRDAQSVSGKSGTSTTPAAVPAFDLYKLAREEELTAYRGLCRVLAMHYGADALTSDKPSDAAAAKYQRRLLEDLRDALCISQERSELELRAAAEDEVVAGIHRSGVLRRRADFFDGVEDVEVVANMAEGRATDDGNALYVPPAKEPRGEHVAARTGTQAHTGTSSGAGGGATAPAPAVSAKARATARKKMLTSIAELGQEAQRLANTLLYSEDKTKESELKERLLATREKLLELKEEISLTGLEGIMLASGEGERSIVSLRTGPPCARLLLTCKRKQYDGVRGALTFLLPLVESWLAAGNGSTMAPSAAALLRSITEAGVPATLSHSGPLLDSHLGALRDPEWVPLLEAVFSRFPRPALSYAGRRTVAGDAEAWVNLYPTPALPAEGDSHAPAAGDPLAEARLMPLWSQELETHYVAALTEVHNDRPSRDLCKEGYLHEAGLLTRRVFVDSAPHPTPREARWASLIDAYSLFLPDRSHIHELENMPQEIAIGEMVVEALAKMEPGTAALSLVVDVGGGNGFLAAQVGERVGCDSLVVDPLFPSHAIDCCPRLWADTHIRTRAPRLRQRQLARFVGLFGDLVWDRDVGVPPSCCALIAKHLCGTAIDTCLAHLDAQMCLPRLLVLVPCCFNKGNYDEYINRQFLSEVLHVNDQDAYGLMSRITDWNHSVHQKRKLDGPPDCSRNVAADGDRHGRHSKKSVGHLISCSEVLARSVEALLNRGRMMWLEDRGYTTELREYVPDCVTPKNKCIIAYRKHS